MTVRLHPHAEERAGERGATQSEVISAVQGGEQFPAKYGRIGFRRNFAYNGVWNGLPYANKQVEAIAVREGPDWVVITVLVKFF